MINEISGKISTCNLIWWSRLIATGFYSGCAPKAPGTVGTFAAFACWLVAEYSTLLTTFQTRSLCALAVFLVGWVATAFYIRNSYISSDDSTHPDPQEIVIDEWAGLYFGLALVPALSFFTACLVCIFFRVFDITKWGPIGRAEKWGGSLGIMADDMIAGLCAALATYCTKFVLSVLL